MQVVGLAGWFGLIGANEDARSAAVSANDRRADAGDMFATFTAFPSHVSLRSGLPESVEPELNVVN
jgi:hypothetical protein